MKLKARDQAFRIALIYVMASSFWILFSDGILTWTIGDSKWRIALSLVKGWAFVLLTGSLLYYLVRRLLRHWELEAEQRLLAELERQRTVDLLHRNQEQMRLVLEASADGLWDWDLKTGLLDLSPRYWEIIGYTPGEVVANREFLQKTIRPEDWASIQLRLAEHFAGKTSQVACECRMITKSGVEIWVWSRGKVVARAADGTPTRMAGTISDITQQKRADLLLAKTAEHHRQLFENMNEGFASCRMILEDGRPVDFVFLAVNSMFTTLTGLEDAVGKRVSELIPGLRESDPELFDIYGEVARTGRPKKFERYVHALNMWFEIAAYRTEPDSFVAVFDEITERKRAEQTLRESEERYRQLFDLEADAIVVADCETHQILDVNLSGQKLYGYSRDEFLRMRLEDVSVEPEKSSASVDSDERHVPLRWHRRKNGERFAVEITANVVEYRGQRLKLGAIRDITARLRAEESSRENEERFHQLANNITDVFWICSPDYQTVHYVSPGYEKIWGRTPQSLYANPDQWLEAIPAGDRDRVLAVFAALRDKETEVGVEFSIVRPDGAVRWVHDRGFPVRDAAGSVIRLAGIVTDITEQKLAEQKLQESEERYRQLFELESDAVILLDCETRRFVDVNQSAQRLYGYTRDEFLRMSVEEVSDEPDLTRALAGTGDHFVPLRWHRKKNGDRFAVEITTNTFTHQGRRTELATIRDITSRQQVMEMLADTADQLLEAQRIAGLGSYNLDVANGFWVSSQVLDELFGINDPDFKRDLAGWLQLVHPEERAEMERYLAQDVLGKHQPFDRVYRIVRLNDHQERWVRGLGKLVLGQNGEVRRMVGVIQDVTDSERAKEQMAVQFSALTAAANAITITNVRGVIEWVNPAFTKLTGYPADEAVGNDLRLLKSGEQPPSFFANLWATILTGNVWRGELVNRRKDGRLYTEEMTVTPVRGANGQIAHFVAIKQDVSERQSLEKRMRQAQKMEAIGTLAGGIAHDFNNILAAMFGYAYLLQQDVAGNAVAEENIGEILKAAGRAKDLVQQILTFSRQREQKPEVIPLDLVVKEAIKFLRASLPAQIQIEMNLAPDAPAVLADPTQIYQVTINLATNALHAMEGQAGRLMVSLERFQPDMKFIRDHPEMRPMLYTRLTVADTGHGMDAKTMERIFEPFFTTKPIGKGTGLGLAVVHGIVESHGGTITVESELGRGTTFRLYFPGQMNGKTKAIAGETDVACGQGQKILLVDDEPALTGVLQRLLLRLNYQVVASNSAREAIAWCRENPQQYDLVITDLTMPEINGLEVARQVRAARSDLPVLLASGFSAELNPENLRAAGIGGLIEKPVSITALADAVRRALSAAKSN